MGTCASIHKDPESAVRFRLVVGTKKVPAPSPARGGPPAGEGVPAGELGQKSRRVETGSGFRSPGFGSKDEFFFDSRAWLESDCEDDFFSVNGDFTPSRGSTPNYQTGIAMKPQLNKSLSFEGFPDTKSEPSPRKKLAEFFQETMSEPAGHESNIVGDVQVNRIVKEINTDQIPMSSNGTPCLSQTDSMCSGQRVSNNGFTSGEEKAVKAMQCCLPSFVHSQFNERKKQTPSSELHSGG